MKHDPQKHQRRSIRLPEYDYAQPGAYFVTICTWERAELFGKVEDGIMRLSTAGQIVAREWKRLARQFPHIRLDAFVIMPNHVHGIITIISDDLVRATRTLPTNTFPGNEPVQEDDLSIPDGSPQLPIAVRAQTAISDDLVRATHTLPTNTPSRNEPEPDNIPSGPHGSPQLPIAVRATHTLPTNTPSRNEPEPDNIPSGPHGSPQPPIAVRATHALPTNTSPGNEPVQEDDLSIPDRSPRPPNTIRATHTLPINTLSRTEPEPDNTSSDPHGSPQPPNTDCVDPDRSPRPPNGPAQGSLGAIIGQFKSRVTKRIWTLPKYNHLPIWQRNYYEHIIRNDAEWERIFTYIQSNPLRWQEDRLHPNASANPFDLNK